MANGGAEDEPKGRTVAERISLVMANAGLWLVLIGIGILFVRGLVLESKWAPALIVKSLSYEVGFALLIAGVLVFAVEARARRETDRMLRETIDRSFERVNDRITDLDAAIRKNIANTEKVVIEGISDIASISGLEKLPNQIKNPQVPIIVQEIGIELFGRYIRGMRFIHGSAGFEIDDLDWTMESNRKFYHLLGKHNVTGAEIRITHTGSPNAWDSPAGLASLEEQRSLISNLSSGDNSITRIFVGREPLEQNSDHSRAMSLMRKYGIKTGYVPGNPHDIADMTWIPVFGLVMFWEESAKGRVSSIRFQSDSADRPSLESTWRMLIAQANVA